MSLLFYEMVIVIETVAGVTVPPAVFDGTLSVPFSVAVT
jgi:hypothetical protein